MPKNNHTPTTRLIRLTLGYGFLIFGMIGGFIPVLQGWIFVAIGLILLKDHSTWARRISIWMRKKHPHIRTAFRHGHAHIDRWLKKIGLA